MHRTMSVMLDCLLASSAATFADDHVADVQEYAVIVGDVAVAAKRCDPITVDWARLAVEGRRRAIGERDMSVLRALAQKRMTSWMRASLTRRASGSGATTPL